MTEDKIRDGLRRYIAQVSGQWQTGARASVDYKIIPGVGNPYGEGTRLPTSKKAERIVRSEEALYGRAAARLGPVANFVSTHPLRGLTPERVGGIFNTVLVSGWMLDKACLDEDIILADSHYRSVDNSFRVSIIGSPFTVEPVDSSELAQAVADYQQKVLTDVCHGWQQACKRLLFGDTSGYALEEVIYDWREVSYESGGRSYTVEARTPVGFEWVRNAHTRWNQAEGDRLELDSRDGFFPISQSPHKWLLYTASHDFMIRRRGLNYTNVWLSLIKLNAWARWAATLDIWGIRNPILKYERDRWQDDKFKAEIIAQMQAWGLGQGAALPDDVEVDASPGISDGDARGMHAALLGIINAEQSKLRQGEQLTTETGGAGSYALSETHADTKAEHIEEGEQNLSAEVRSWMRASLRLACEEYKPDGTWGEPLPRGLCAALGATTAQILSKCGRPQWRVTREMTPTVRMKLYDDGVNKLGLKIDSEQPYREFGFAKARSDKQALRGSFNILGPQDQAIGGPTDETTLDNPNQGGRSRST